MAKRFTDTNKYKKPFVRGLQGAYKVLWDYILNDCDHAGIWIVDFEIAQIYLGSDLPVTKEDALKYFNTSDEVRIIEIDEGSKWFILPFIEFQYGELNVKNRVHNSVISSLQKYNLLKMIKPLKSPLQGVKDKDMDKDKDKDKEKEEIVDLEIDDSQEKTIQFLMESFGFTESNHFHHLRTITNCVVCQFTQGKKQFKHFKDQCWNYFSYKELAKERKHNFNTFIGTQEEKFIDGAWNAENWIKKYIDEEAKNEDVDSHIYKEDKKTPKVYRTSKRNSQEGDLQKISKVEKKS